MVENRQHWLDLAGLTGTWRLVSAGSGGRPGGSAVAAALPLLGPGESATVTVPAELFDLPVPPPVGAEVWLVLNLATAHDLPWTAAGTQLGFGQVQLRAESRDLLVRAGAMAGSSARSWAGVSATPVELDDEGLLVHPALAGGPRLSLWRAPTDNDRIGAMAARWDDLGLPSIPRALIGIERDGSGTVVRAEYCPSRGAPIRHRQVLTGVSIGDRTGVLIEETVEIPAGLDDLPRVGSVFETVPGFSWSDWFGSGWAETYPDRCAAGEVGWFSTAADSWYTPYLRPQENGGRHAVRWLQLSDAEPPSSKPAVVRSSSRRLGVHLDQPRQVSVTRYRAADLAAATHPDELVAQPGYVVHVDAAHRGLGTASCGPDTLPQYLFGPGSYRWSYLLSD